MQPNCSRNSGVHSAFAPASMRMAWPSFVGRTGENAARRMPRIRLTSSVAAVSSAPVLPAEMNASPPPCASILAPSTSEEFGCCFTTAAGSQCMSTTSSALASSTPSGSVSQPGPSCWPRISAPRPDQNDLHAELLCRLQCTAHHGIRGVVASHCIQNDFHACSLISPWPPGAQATGWQWPRFLFAFPRTRCSSGAMMPKFTFIGWNDATVLSLT